MNRPWHTTNEWLRFCLAATHEYIQTGLLCLPPSWSIARRADPYAFYAKLRARSPVHRSSLAGGIVVSRAEDIVKILKDDRFSCDASLSQQWQKYPISHNVKALILEEGKPHRRHRGVLANIMNAMRGTLLQLVRARIVEGVAKLEARAEIDVMERFVVPTIRELTNDVLGVPASLRSEFALLMEPGLAFAFHCGDKLIRFPRVMKKDTQWIEKLRAESSRLIDQALSSPFESADVGIIPTLTCEMRKSNVSHEEAAMLTEGVLSALYEPLSYAVGNAIWLMGQNTRSFASIDPENVSSVARETLRYESAVQAIFRYTREDLEFGGKQIHQGENVVLLLGSANRDPAYFENADRFDPDRKSEQNFTFGLGHHACLGAAMAQWVVETSLIELRKRFESIHIQGPGIWTSMLPMRGLGMLPCILHPGAAH